MKRKLFILGTLGLAGLFAGGVVAAYTVTDNAEKTGIKITPGTLTEDKTGSVTLEWGDNTSFTNVSGLRIGSPVTKTVNVKATVKDEEGVTQANEVYLGKLDVELKDLSGKAASAERLIDYLHVSINGYEYDENDGFAAEKSELGVIPTDQDEFVVSLGIYSNSTGKPVDFEISIDAGAAPVMSEIITDQVYLTVDWNRGEAASDELKHVFIPDNGWSAMYVYSYTATAENAAWPGVALTRNAENGLFEGYLADHDYFIFSDGGSNQFPASGQEGMSKDSLNYSTAAAIYFDWDAHTFTSTAPVAIAEYYLLSAPSWSAEAQFGLVSKELNKPDGVSHQFYARVAVEASKDYKFNSASDANVWVGYESIENDSRSLVTESTGGNFRFNAAGTYDIYLKEMSVGGHQVYIVTAPAQ